ncbi:TetR/AcrR family transcriptional regulator [Spirochaeta thermophila]|uniref:Predicted transcriptional activator n=1 Tax=Winmispira thermophila (strain ATCC 49972 / DSM 6192 / RI 19.B1) TaxID=665571 RepID=E0RNR1_WINT6|nr:TetR/AcrR family transcriptional regulator [Spirochaeta thermophila]ADN01184.1 predicted transcriptional activator [Spirochaeta thermophila DSM 6192]
MTGSDLHTVRDTRARIIETASRLFWEHGYDRVPVERIIREVGIAKGTFYHHFRSKEDLLDAVVETFTDSIIDRLDKTLRDTSIPIEEKLTLLINQSVQFKLESIPLMLTILKTWLDPANVTFREKMEQLSLEKFLPLMARFIEEGTEAGIFHIGRMRPRDVARFIMTLSFAITNETAEYLLGLKDHPEYEEKFTTLYESFQYAYERMLGLPEGYLDSRIGEFLRATKAYLEKGADNGDR